MASGPPVVVATNGQGYPVRQVTANAPLLTVTQNGMGFPIVISDLGTPFIVQGLYDPDASALFARFTTPPTNARKTAINTAIVSLKSAGVWSKLDALYLMAAADEQAGQRNWISNTLNLTPVLAPAFAVDQGYTGNGSTSYLETNAATNALSKYVRDSANFGIWSRTNLQNGAGNSDDAGANLSRFTRLTTTGNVATRVNTSASFSPVGWQYPGHLLWSRTGATAWAGYKNGAQVTSGVDASVVLDAATIKLLRFMGGGYGVNQLAAAHFGSALTGVEASALYSAINTYLVSVGAA